MAEKNEVQAPATIDNVVEIVEKPYELYPLKADDLFLLIRVLKGVDLKRLAGVFANKVDVTDLEQAQKSIDDLGMDTVIECVGIIIDNLPNCKDDLYVFLASVSNLDEAQIANMPIGDFISMIKDVVTGSGFVDFFTQATKLLQ